MRALLAVCSAVPTGGWHQYTDVVCSMTEAGRRAHEDVVVVLSVRGCVGPAAGPDHVSEALRLDALLLALPAA